MNKIQELAAQAKASVPQGILGVDKWIETYNQIFAELIVRECLDQVDEFSRLTKAYLEQGIDPEIDIKKEVLKNFGLPRFPRS